MATVKLYDQMKKEVGNIDLAPEVFEVEVRAEILNLVVRAQRAAQRQGTHATKNRALIEGGSSKPWRQKGTGRARAGSGRSPLWRGGATIFGPQPRSYAFKVNKKVRQLAMKMALSSRLATENLVVVDKFELPEIKTKLMTRVCDDLGLKKALIVVGKEDNNLSLSARNIPGVTVMTQERLNVYDVLRHQQLVLDEAAATTVQDRLK
ncbi:MAG: 50S ribosomal protein L4 [Desulfovibrionaceae bacterium]|jgi:large subunit ribosomal protein L4|nr:50S ribosomal protein L4 [Desulfovibrionaceae bacterium]